MTDDEFESSPGSPGRIEPVLVQVGDRELYLGDRYAADPEYHDRDFGVVVSLTSSRRPLTTHHHPLHDGPGNDFEDFAVAVDEARAALDDSEIVAVLVHCAAGISRSSTVITTTVAAEEDREFDDVLGELKRHRERVSPHLALRALAREYLGETPTPAEADALERDQQRNGSLIDRLEAKTTQETQFVDATDRDDDPDATDCQDNCEAKNMKTDTNDGDSKR